MTIESTKLINLDDFRADPRFKNIDGRGHAVVIIDGSFDLDHPFFGPGIRTDENGIDIAERIVYQYDFADDDIDANPPDPVGTFTQGTHVASIAVSSDPTHTGMAPGADIILFKVWTREEDPDTGEDTDITDRSYVEKALQWVENQINDNNRYNIASVNLSFFNSGNYNQPEIQSPYSDELERLANLGVILVGGAGDNFNTFNSVPGVSYPAADPNVLSVGAVYDNDFGGPFNYRDGSQAVTTGPDRITPYSQRHGTMTTIFAPGEDITAANVGGGTRTSFGTGRAAPHIAGIAALAQQLAMQELGRKLTPTEFADLLRDTGVTINDGDDEDDNVTNTGLDFKRVDVDALGNAIVNIDKPPFFSNPYYPKMSD